MWIGLFHVAIFILPFITVYGIHARSKRGVSSEELRYYLLLNFLIYCVGIQGLVTGFIQIFSAEGHCDYLNRPWSPFIWELGMMNISYGILGIMCIWLRGSFWVAVGIGYSLFLSMAFAGHLYEAAFSQNYSIGNIGPQIWIDLSIAAVLFYLIFRGKKQ